MCGHLTTASTVESNLAGAILLLMSIQQEKRSTVTAKRAGASEVVQEDDFFVSDWERGYAPEKFLADFNG
jgi:hypothetical protein